MDFKRWLAEERLRTHTTSKKEIRGLLEIVQRDLNDASVPDLSTDRRFLIATKGQLHLRQSPCTAQAMKHTGKGIIG
jgi:hypothetical protein